MSKKINYKDGSGNGAGPYSVTDMPLTHAPEDESLKGNSPHKDISRKVDSAHDVNGGYAGEVSRNGK